MSFAFTARLPLSRHEIDRDHLRRLDDAQEALRTDAAARVLPLWRGKALVRQGGGLELVAANRLPGALLTIYLGLSLATDAPEPAGTPLFAVVLSDDAATALEPDETRWIGLREFAAGNAGGPGSEGHRRSLSDRDTGAFTEALAVANWHESHGHCPRCGAPTAVEDGGWTRRCPVDGSQVFPRTDPAIIVLITDTDDRILLGSNALWENNRYSLLAGFVEPGESLEAAVIREMREESGLRVTDPEYLGSQPWPFPASIMCGFTARLADDQQPHDLMPDGEEILDLRWFSRDELRAHMAGDALPGRIILPGASSIARAMVEHWLGEPLE